ncbi:replication-associated recombination protein A [Dehalobacterium formicoaceticum]|uniref:Replication-associated recombination protein A n=1 Tax=Dehalobacterium formicoaceticum TaxID=51515 RepID=A0ABT1YA30_9FIRM|nr:replication-associated recombination protein A [Dehalobacterium formicoaceticum]
MDLFEYARKEVLKKAAPLAARMRPKGLEDFFGQEEIVGPGSLLRRSIEGDQFSSAIFYGPPGSGKTTLAQVIANSTKAHFEELSAVTAGIADLKKVIQEAKDRLGMYNQKTILFIDEIHRFNKGQQDALLPAVEDGTLILIGATTENPYFEVNSALLSRSRIFRLQTLSQEDIKKILLRALDDREQGLGGYRVQINEDALNHLADMAGGDARIALNALELAVTTTPPQEDGIRHIDLKVAEQSIQRRAVKYDKKGDYHYDIVSAFIKSMRGSDPDATLHWMARMLDAGEDPEFIMRRIIICAAEDVGLADPEALKYAMAAAQALAYVGLPEARLPMASAALYVACAPKSNAVIKGIDGALSDVKVRPTGEVPMHLRDAHYQGAKKLGHGKHYQYPQDYPGNFIAQQYLPEELAGTIYYHPTENGLEKKILDRLKKLGLR